MAQKRPPLRVATKADAIPAPSTLKAAAALDERALLVMSRDHLAASIDAGVPAHALAPLMRLLRETTKELAALDARAKEEALEGGVIPDEAWDSEAL